MKRDTTKLLGALTLVVILTISMASVFMAQKFALVLFHFMHETFNSYKWEFSIVFLFIFWGVFFGLMLAVLSIAGVIKHNLSHHSTEGK